MSKNSREKKLKNEENNMAKGRERKKEKKNKQE